jgi:copper chaperone CopZ
MLFVMRLLLSISVALCLIGCASKPAVAPSAATVDKTLVVKGLSCPLCASNLDKRLLKLPGVQSAVIDLGTGTVHMKVVEGASPTDAELAKAVEAAGFSLDRVEAK